MVLIATIALLYRWGGEWDKSFRRFGIGIVFVVIGMLSGIWWSIFAAATSQLFRLPITFDIGGGKKGELDTWQDWLWIPVCGFLYGLVPAPLAVSASDVLTLLHCAALFSIVFTVLVALSNYEKTANYFKWDVLETLFGALIGYIAHEVL